jgi:hypothetical protein
MNKENLTEEILEKAKEEYKFINESEISIFWPTTTDQSDRLVKISDTERNDFIKVTLGKNTFLNDVLYNVEYKSEEPEVLSFNIMDLVDKDKTKYNESEPYSLLGNILFIDKDNNHVILSNDQFITIADQIFYMPKDIYLAIDLKTGNIVFKNALKSSDMYVKYMCLFLIKKSDNERLENENKKTLLSEEERKALNTKAIEGFTKLSPEQQYNVTKLLDKILYDKADADIQKFENSVNKEEEPKRIKVPLKDDGTVDLDLFTDQICPEFANREIDISTIEFEKENKTVPQVDENDVKNLGMIGFSPKDTTNMIENLKNIIIETSKEVDELNTEIDSLKPKYDNSFSTCLSLISNGTYNSKEYDATIKNNYTTLALMLDTENRYKKVKDTFTSAQQTLASFQYISRKSINKAIENGEFTNKHTFSALTIFFKSMLDAKCITSMNDNYGVHIAYLKFINKKYKELDGNKYFDGILMDVFNPERDTTIYSITKDLLIRFVRINDLRDIETKEAIERIITRVQERIRYLYDISYYPINVSTRAFPEIVTISSFADDINNDDEYKKQQAFIEDSKKKGWPINEKFEDDSEIHILKSIQEFKDKLDNPEIIEGVTGFFKMMWMTVLHEYIVKILKKSYKNRTEFFNFAITNTLLFRIVNTLEIIVTKEIKTKNDKNEEVVEKLDDKMIKTYIGRFLVELGCFIIFIGTSLRVNNLMVKNVMDIEKLNESDAQSFFSVILNGLIIPIEVIENVVDTKNVQENDLAIDSIISDEKSKYLGKESTKIFFNGLKGFVQSNAEDKQNDLFENNTRLYLARKELLKESAIFTANVFDLINRFLDFFTPGRE